MQFRKHFLLYILSLLILLLVSASFYRFIILQDYIVVFEGSCDPLTENCFIGCNNDECTDVYYFVKVQRHASELYGVCGTDITDCDLANTCTVKSETSCSVTPCDLLIDGDSCEMLTDTTLNET